MSSVIIFRGVKSNRGGGATTDSATRAREIGGGRESGGIEQCGVLLSEWDRLPQEHDEGAISSDLGTGAGLPILSVLLGGCPSEPTQRP